MSENKNKFTFLSIWKKWQVCLYSILLVIVMLVAIAVTEANIISYEYSRYIIYLTVIASLLIYPLWIKSKDNVSKRTSFLLLGIMLTSVLILVVSVCLIVLFHM
jgi:hypothetical protein